VAIAASWRYNACTSMADWKQITARIRRARTSKDPAGQLSALYEKTHDAMVAFELAKYFESSGTPGDAAKWYGTAAQKFRRADWKTKAQEAATRLGGEASPTDTQSEFANRSTEELPATRDLFASAPSPVPEPGLPFAQNAETYESIVTSPSAPEAATPGVETSSEEPPPTSDQKRRRRRGRRGGRNRRKPGSATQHTRPDQSVNAVPLSRSPATEDQDSQPEIKPPSRSRTAAAASGEPAAKSAGSRLRGRQGDPGLSSRISLLEMQFRRLLSCPAVTLDEADTAPASPGVFVLTESDLSTYYYVEACQTLRIAIANLLRSGKRTGESLVKQLAGHLGIAESRVPKYLADHCTVRWLQLDDDASHFAHFVIAVLRPVLND
jgi:hypothetical protein